MQKGRRTRIIVAFLGAATLLLGAIGIAYVVNGNRGFASCSGLLGCGWIIPLGAGLIIALVVWLLSSQTPKYTDDVEAVDSPPCAECGSPAREGWRLCPACGARLRE